MRHTAPSRGTELERERATTGSASTSKLSNAEGVPAHPPSDLASVAPLIGRAAKVDAGIARQRLLRRSWFRLAVVSSILVVIGAEVVFRWGFHEQLGTRFLPAIYISDDLLGYRYEPNSVSTISVPSIHKTVRINEHGYYGPTWTQSKPGGTYRIAIVGASIASGVWLNSGVPYPQQLERLFESTPREVEVLNFSIDGSDRDLAMLRQIDTEVLKFQPDLILLVVEVPFPRHVIHREMYRGYILKYGHSGLSQATLLENRMFLHEYVDRLRVFPGSSLYDASFIVRAFCRWYRQRWEDSYAAAMEDYYLHIADLDVIPPRSTLEQSMARLRNTMRTVEASGSKLLVLRYGGEEAQAWQASVFRRYRIPYLSLGLFFDSTLRHAHDGHPNERGQALIAEKLFRALESLVVSGPSSGSAKPGPS